MTTASVLTPASPEERSWTPKEIERYTQSLIDPTFATAVPGMRPRVEVYPHADGIVMRVSVTGEGFTGDKEEVRTYALRRLAEETQIRAAIWLQVSALLSKLKPIPSADEEGE